MKSFPANMSSSWRVQITDSSGGIHKKNFGPWIKAGVDGTAMFVSKCNSFPMYFSSLEKKGMVVAIPLGNWGFFSEGGLQGLGLWLWGSCT